MSSLSTQSSLPQLLVRFYEQFGQDDDPPAVFFAPGRVNLIGDHTDVTGGLVFPCGISQGTWLLIRRTRNQQYRLASTNFDFTAHLGQQAINRLHDNHWINYPLGVMDQFIRQGTVLDGFDCLYSGDVPHGAGLSSSASLEVVTAFAINTLMKSQLPLLTLVKMSQAAENDFVGMQCGIMDQFAVAMAEKDHALQLNCATLEHRLVRLQFDAVSIVVTNTHQRRELNESAYNDRVAECARALQILAPVLNIDSLGQLSPQQLTDNEALFGHDPVALMRAQHVCTENARVRDAVPALEAGDIATFGELMNQSHDSLRSLFEVSSAPLDHLVRLARAQPGVLGSRLTGAGFGGCTVSLVPDSGVDRFKQEVSQGYSQTTNLTPTFYIVQASQGVRQLSLE